MMRIKEQLSPNRNGRPAAPDMLMFHYTGMRSAEAAIARLCDPVARVSAHYVVCEDGEIVQLVPEEERAWHAGVSAWRGRRGLNDTSIGIEIVNPGHEWGYRPFPQPQMRATLELAQRIVSAWHISPFNVVGHSDVAPARKEDPGELFPWPRFAAHGVGLWPATTYRPSPADPSCELESIGYDMQIAERTEMLRAFQRRWLPETVSGELNALTRARISQVAALFSQRLKAG